MRNHSRSVRPLGVLLAAAIVIVGCVTPARANYRDFKVFATSRPDSDNAALIHVALAMHNDGRQPLALRAKLGASTSAGFAGDTFAVTVKPGDHATWRFELRPPEGLVREVLVGEMWFGDLRARELYIAVRGPDPDDFDDKDVDKLTDRAQAVAVYVPRTREAIDQLRAQAAADRPKPSVVIASQGKTAHTLVIDPLPDDLDIAEGATAESILAAWQGDKPQRPGEPALIAAASDLVRCVKVQSGADLPIAREGTSGPTIRLHVTDPLAGRKPWPHFDSYQLLIKPDGNVLIESGTLDGLRQGIYGLLTDHMDCHWFLPRKLGEEIVVPDDRTVRLLTIEDKQTPSFFSATGMSWGNARPWDRRNRAYINRGRMRFGHSWYGYLNSSEYPYDKYPEMWARDREGKVRVFDTAFAHTNFCSTNPKVIEIVARKANQSLSGPNAIVTSLDPEDAAPLCLCDRCLAVDRSYGVKVEDGSHVSDRLLHFSKEIYDRLDEANKDKYLGILVYGHQMELPVSAKAHPHHTGLICDMPWAYDHTRPFNDPTSPRNRHFHELLKGWGAQLSQFGYYDYYGHWAYWGPWGVINKLREDLPAFRDLGGTYIMIESQPNFAMHGLNLYIASRLAWNVDTDVDLLLDEFYRKFYGPAAEPMRQYWQAIDRHQALTRTGSNVHLRVATRPGLYEELFGYLDEAVERVQDAPQRFRDRVTYHRDGLLWGQRRASIEITYRIRLFRPGDFEKEENKDRDYTGALKLIEENRDWFDTMFKRYGGGESDYWPALTPSYFRPKSDAMIEAIRKHMKGRAGDAALAVPDI